MSLNIATPEFHKFASEIFDAKIKQTNLADKNDFDDKLISLNKKIHTK